MQTVTFLLLGVNNNIKILGLRKIKISELKEKLYPIKIGNNFPNFPYFCRLVPKKILKIYFSLFHRIAILFSVKRQKHWNCVYNELEISYL